MPRKIRCWKFPRALGNVVFDPRDSDFRNYFVGQVKKWAEGAKEGEKLELTAIRFYPKELAEMGEYDGD